MKKFAAICLALLGYASAAHASIIMVGNYTLQPNMAGQQIQLLVTGGTSVQGVQLQVQVADGGPLGNGVITGPVITDLDVIDGTIFAGNNTGQQGPPNGVIVPQVASAGTTTASGTVSSSGLLATVTFDTTGFFGGGPWDLLLKGTLNGDTVFGDIVPTISNGTIIVVPEPGTLLVAAAGLLILKRTGKNLRDR